MSQNKPLGSKRWVASLGLVLSLGCGDRAAEQHPASLDFDRLFAPVWEVALEEPDSAPIGQLKALRPAPAGGFIVADMMNSQLRLHDREGRLARLVGRYGAGPGEFRGPSGVAIGPAGEIYVVEFGANRVTRLRPDMSLDTILPLPPAAGTHVALFGGRIFVGLRRSKEAEFGFLDEAGEFTGLSRWDPEIAEVPYWSNVAVDHVAVGSRALAIANSLKYPIWYYTSPEGPGRAFGEPPASWSGASRLKGDEFAGGRAGTQKLGEWLNTFTVVAGLHMLSDSLILVSHGRYRTEPGMPMPEMFRIHPYAVDVYDLAGRKLVEDVPLPGTIIAADSLVYIVDGEPPAVRRLIAYRLGPDAERSIAR